MTDIEKKLLKEELKNELRLEIKVDLKELVKKEIRIIIFEERYFETPFRAYIKSLLYDDVHYLRMLNAGMVKHGETIVEIPKTSTGTIWMKIKDNVDIEKLFKECIEGGLMEASYQDFFSIMNFESESGYISWVQKGRKGYTYKGIFELYESIYNEDFFNLNPIIEKKFLAYLSNKFLLGFDFKNVADFEKSFKKIYKKK